MRYYQTDCLKETGFSLIKPITIKEAKTFLKSLIKVIEMKRTFIKVNKLPPGFDIAVGIKQSCIYFGYWGENSFIRILICSCKDYDEKKVKKYIEEYFNTKVLMKVLTYTSVLEEEKKLCGKN